jgi:hypothetical protein
MEMLVIIKFENDHPLCYPKCSRTCIQLKQVCHCFVWLQNMVSYFDGKTLIKRIWKQSAQENMWT